MRRDLELRSDRGSLALSAERAAEACREQTAESRAAARSAAREASEASEVRLVRNILADRDRRLDVVGREDVRRREHVRVAVLRERVKHDAERGDRDARAEKVLRVRDVRTANTESESFEVRRNTE